VWLPAVCAQMFCEILDALSLLWGGVQEGERRVKRSG
jgi:hypothetical protein